jgi:hypothetical protein
LVELAPVGIHWSTADKLKPGGVSGNNYTSVDQVHTTGIGSLITCASKKQSKNVVGYTVEDHSATYFRPTNYIYSLQGVGHRE